MGIRTHADVDQDPKQFGRKEGISLVRSLLSLDPAARPNVREARAHDWCRKRFPKNSMVSQHLKSENVMIGLGFQDLHVLNFLLISLSR
jgi:hypothetical protein